MYVCVYDKNIYDKITDYKTTLQYNIVFVGLRVCGFIFMVFLYKLSKFSSLCFCMYKKNRC